MGIQGKEVGTLRLAAKDRHSMNLKLGDGGRAGSRRTLPAEDSQRGVSLPDNVGCGETGWG